MARDCFADFERADALLRRSLELEPVARERFVARECAEDRVLQRRVLGLLHAARDESGAMAPGGALTGAIWAGMTDTPAGAVSLVGEMLGPWRVGNVLGLGGMATVYRGERADGAYEQTVAIKILHGLKSFGRLEARFTRERAILARLNHPNIARLLDGGTTSSGWSYLVMEYVQGESIDHYCSRRRLSIEARLRLFLKVCAAVQSAHRQLIVHRDLKPSNILVTGAGVPKLLDFGIAKLLDPDPEGGDPTRTALMDRVLTPQYASPEQILGEPISTATDVHALGLLLYELLTGHRARRLDSSRPSDIERVACEETPAAPSDVASTDIPDPEGNATVPVITAAAARRLTPAALRRRLKGDLDNIVLKAVRREPERRYDSAERFAADIRRHLESRPVCARPDRLRYRTRKFLKRHALGAATAAGVLVFAAILVGFYTDRLARERNQAQQLAQQAEREANRANRVADFLVELFEAGDPYQRADSRLTVSNVLERAVRRIDTELENQPLLQARLFVTLGQAYSNLADYDRAQPLLEKALKLRRQALGDDAAETAASLRRLAQLIYRRGKYSAARPLFEEALAVQERALGARDPVLAETLNDLGNLYKRVGEFGASKARFEQALEIARANFVNRPMLVGKILNNFGLLLSDMGHFAEARDILEETLAVYERELGPDHLMLAETLGNLSHVHDKLDQHEKQVAVCRRYLEVTRRELDRAHPSIGHALICLGNAYRSTNRNREAIPLYEEAVKVYRESAGRTHAHVAYPLANLGNAYRDAGHNRQAMAYYEQAMAIFENNQSTHLIAAMLEKMGRLQLAMDRPAASERNLRRALSLRKELRPEGHWRIAEVQAALGRCLMQMGRLDEAEHLLTLSLNKLRNDRGIEHEETQHVVRHLVALYEARNKPSAVARYRKLMAEVKAW